MLSSPPLPSPSPSPSGRRYSGSASASVTSELVGGGGSTRPRPYRSFSAGSRPRSLLAVLPEYLQRLTDLKQMDFEFACSQMVNLCRAPSAAYRSTKLRKEIKNQWARDDPAFVAILLCFMTVSAIAYSVAFGWSSPAHFLRLVFGAVLVDFLVSGIIISSTCWWIANQYMRSSRVLPLGIELEWLYAFDVHCNAFFPLFVLLYVVQFYLSPLLLLPSFLSTFVANTLYAAAFAYYHYVSFLGYSVVSFIERPERFLLPVGIIAALYVVSIFGNVNLSRVVLHWYFGK